MKSSTELKETELRLGLPGSHSPERKRPQPSRTLTSSGVTLFSPLVKKKRGFSDAIDGLNGNWALNGSEVDLGKGGVAFFSPRGDDAVKEEVSGANGNNGSPASMGQVVGWPPIRSFRKNTMVSNLVKDDEEAEEKTGFACFYVKVSMEGAPYLRKVDLKTYSNYMELSSALEKMFRCFTIGKCCSQGLYGKDGLNETSLKNLLHDSEYVLTYEDKDGDWMLVGDVPWELFTESCMKLRIMKGSEAIGLAPRAMQKCKIRN